MRALLPVALVIAVAALVGGCGQDKVAEERNVYADQVNRAQGAFAQSFRSLSRRITTTTTPGQGRRTLAGFENAVDTVVTNLRRIDAPDGLQTLHRRLIREMRVYRREIHKAKVAFATGAPQRILRAQSALVSATTAISRRIDTTIAAINRTLQQT